MDPSKRNAAALNQRVDNLVTSLLSHYQSILSHAAEDPASDYSRAAQRELAIKHEAGALITTAQDMSVLIRELQELWLFGGLDTLEDKKDEVGERERVEEIAGLVEKLARGKAKGGQGGRVG